MSEWKEVLALLGPEAVELHRALVERLSNIRPSSDMVDYSQDVLETARAFQAFLRSLQRRRERVTRRYARILESTQARRAALEEAVRLFEKKPSREGVIEGVEARNLKLGSLLTVAAYNQTAPRTALLLKRENLALDFVVKTAYLPGGLVEQVEAHLQKMGALLEA